MTVAREKCLKEIRRLETSLDYARRMNEAHISKLESENATLRKEIEAAKMWQNAFQKGHWQKLVKEAQR